MTAPRLDELQRWMHRMFREEVSVEATAAAVGADPDRLAIYARFVRGHVRHALEINYPATLSLLSDEVRAGLVADFYRAHPAPDPSLDAAAAPFADFLLSRAESAPGEGPTPFHAALARLEFTLGEVARDPAEPARAALAADAVPALNPTLRALESSHPVVAFLASWDAEAAARTRTAPPAAAPELVLVFRHPERHTACYHVATDALLFAVKLAHDGLTPRQAAVASGAALDDVLAAVRAAATLGLIVSTG